MDLRLLDEVTPLPGFGIMLMSMDEVRGEGLLQAFANGGLLVDALGNQHQLAAVQKQEGLYLLHLPKDDAAYWERLFRKVTVDATLVRLMQPEDE